jgi:ABC-type uncharacterized transport system ATPase subunit
MTEPASPSVELRKITKRFGAVLANDAVSLAVQAASVHALVGENGAGKSTAMKILYGFYQADSGEILIDGHRESIKSPRHAIDLGLGMVHQHFTLVETLTVTENIILGAEPRVGLCVDYGQARRLVRQLSERYSLETDPDKKISQLSVGQHQRVEILKTLYRGARILILDEPTAVLTPQEVAELFQILRGLREQGKTVIIITHKLREVLSLSDNITVMRDGRVVGEVPAKEATAEGLAKMMIGREVLLRVQKTSPRMGKALLRIDKLVLRADTHTAGDLRAQDQGQVILDDVSFEVRAGEILAVAGVEGNGQTELLEIISGLRRQSDGDLYLEDVKLNDLGLRERKQLGIAHIPEDRHKHGLLLPFDLAENSILGVQREPSISGHFLLKRKSIINRARRLVRDYDVRPPDITLPARALSGGNQQKLIVARELDINPKLVLVAQPTRGVDIGAAEFIHRKIVELRDRGAAVLLVSAELDEVLSLGDRVIVLFKGRVVGEVDPESVSQQAIGMMMTCGKPLITESE